MEAEAEAEAEAVGFAIPGEQAAMKETSPDSNLIAGRPCNEQGRIQVNLHKEWKTGSDLNAWG